MQSHLVKFTEYIVLAMLKNKFPLDLQKVSKKYADADLTTKEAADGEVVAVHRVLMAQVSPKLGELFEESNQRKGEPIVVRNVRFQILSAIVDFVYSGQINLERRGPEFIEDFIDGLNLMKIDVTEKASTKLAEELRKSKELVKELRELERKLEILKRKNNLEKRREMEEKGRKRPRNEDISDENLNKKKCEPCNPTASKTNEKSGDGVPTSTSSPSKPAQSEFKESRRVESMDGGRRRCKEEVKVKRERQESWEPSDVEENFDLRSVLHEKQKQEAEVKRRESSWHRAQQQEKGSYHDGGGEGRWEFGRYSYTKWLKWNFEPRRIPEPDPNWPQQMQVPIVG